MEARCCGSKRIRRDSRLADPIKGLDWGMASDHGGLVRGVDKGIWGLCQIMMGDRGLGLLGKKVFHG